jgi:hypothetical protein
MTRPLSQIFIDNKIYIRTKAYLIKYLKEDLNWKEKEV